MSDGKLTFVVDGNPNQGVNIANPDGTILLHGGPLATKYPGYHPPTLPGPGLLAYAGCYSIAVVEVPVAGPAASWSVLHGNVRNTR